MELAVLIASLVACAIAVVASVVSVWHAARPPDRQMRLDIDELLTHVERLAADTKREKMRRVRAGLQDEAPASLSSADHKRVLRMRVHGGGITR